MAAASVIRGPVVYLDTNVIIYAFEDFAAMGDRVRAAFALFDQNRLRVITSELTLAEVLVKPVRDGNLSHERHYTEQLGGGPIETISVTRSILIESARLRKGTALRLPDAIHAATALAQGCTTFLTNDPQFRTVPGLPVVRLADLA